MTVSTFPALRLRRLRQHPILRDLIRETQVNINDLILPLFIKGTDGEKKPIGPMPGQYQIPLNRLAEEIEEITDLGISSVLLFGIPSHKDSCGSDSYDEHGIVQSAIRKIRETSSDLLIISDVCFCEYTDHGHCGFLTETTGRIDVDNDKTLELLVKQAISHAEAGAHVIAPSGMIDGMISTIREGLDSSGFSHIPLLSYSAKYNSSLYGPFRAAAEGAPSFGDRSTHMMDIANGHEAIREVQLDIVEGADMLMVKPAHSYLDIIYRIKQAYPHIPLGAYHTSGEYAMIKAAAEKGWINEKNVVMEILTGIRRAGADFIITYYAKEFAKWDKGYS
ncbi:MAG: porphobilinogen synthase [Parachlamydiaceae bacterium]